jgi:energy-coupling factor transporter ATP-binding protein EcfA2
MKDNIVRKYLNGEIDSDIEKNNILNLDKDLIKVCDGKTLLVKGEMTLIVGGKNSGKSKFMNYLLKQLLIDELDNGFELMTNDDIKVIYFDSEMGENRLANWSIEAPYSQYGIDYIEETLSDKLFIYSLKKESTLNRPSCIHSIYNQLQNMYPNTHFITCVDVGTCLTSDLNNQNNAGIIDDLVRQLSQSTLIVTIHHSLKDEEKRGVSMGSIGTALEKYCAIKLVIDSTDEQKRHKVEFHVSKYQDVNKDKDYFYIQTEKVDEKIIITGISDSNGILIKEKKGHLKMSEIEFEDILNKFLTNLDDENLRTRKNIVEFFKNNYNIGKSKVHSHLKTFIDNSIIIEKNHLIYFI